MLSRVFSPNHDRNDSNGIYKHEGLMDDAYCHKCGYVYSAREVHQCDTREVVSIGVVIEIRKQTARRCTEIVKEHVYNTDQYGLCDEWRLYKDSKKHISDEFGLGE